MKRYTIITDDLEIIDSIRAWAMEVGNASTFTQAEFGEQVTYSILLGDRWGPETEDERAARFLELFGSSVQAYE